MLIEDSQTDVRRETQIIFPRVRLPTGTIESDTDDYDVGICMRMRKFVTSSLEVAILMFGVRCLHCLPALRNTNFY